MLFERIEEFLINNQKTKAIQNLLQNSFEQYPKNRIFYTQAPHFRFLVWENTQLIAQSAVVYRTVSLGALPLRILGVMDLCVTEGYRKRGIGSEILQKITDLATENHLDFILLFGSDESFYRKNGFSVAENNCRWTLIKDFQTLGIVHRKIPNTLLFKPIGQHVWQQDATLDLLGFVF
jgi:predicted N-acetyltransferase YhbS